MEAVIGVGIGLVLVFAVLAVVVSSAMELIAAGLRLRARNLEYGIARLLDGYRPNRDDGLKWLYPTRLWKNRFHNWRKNSANTTNKVLRHPLVSALSRTDRHSPSYIDSVTFATAFLGSAITSEGALASCIAQDEDALKDLIGGLSAGEPADSVRKSWQDSGHNTDKLVEILLSDRAHGIDGLVALLGQQKPPVRERIATLVKNNDPAAPLLNSKWAQANGDIKTFVRSLEPSLFKHTIAGHEAITAAIRSIRSTNPHLGDSLYALWERSGSDLAKFRGEIEGWFDREMARVSGWYSRKTQWVMLGIAAVLVVGLNISATTIGRALWIDPTLREDVAIIAEQQTSTTVGAEVAGATTIEEDGEGASTAGEEPIGVETLEDAGLPMGWNSATWPGWQWGLALHLTGMIVVAIAASFGAPVWFDLLNRLVNLRTTSKPPPTTVSEAD